MNLSCVPSKHSTSFRRRNLVDIWSVCNSPDFDLFSTMENRLKNDVMVRRHNDVEMPFNIFTSGLVIFFTLFWPIFKRQKKVEKMTWWSDFITTLKWRLIFSPMAWSFFSPYFNLFSTVENRSRNDVIVRRRNDVKILFNIFTSSLVIFFTWFQPIFDRWK